MKKTKSMTLFQNWYKLRRTYPKCYVGTVYTILIIQIQA